MTTDSIKLFSTIKPDVLRKSLFKGTFLASLGVIILIAVTTYLPLESMATWGTLFLLVGGGLMVYGLIPYRKLVRMESDPSELILIDNQYLQFITFKKQQYTIPLTMIDKTEYVEKGDDYGIAIWFKEAVDDKVVVHNQKLNMQKITAKSKEKYECDLFIPYFGRRAYTRLALY